MRNLEKEQVLQKAEMLRDASGEKNRKVRGGRVVASLNEGVRGVWDPFHGAGDAGRVLGRRGGGRGVEGACGWEMVGWKGRGGLAEGRAAGACLADGLFG